MVKTRTKAEEEEVEEIDESYYSESDDASQEQPEMREIDQENIGNYESDSDDEDLDSDEDIGRNL